MQARDEIRCEHRVAVRPAAGFAKIERIGQPIGGDLPSIRRARHQLTIRGVADQPLEQIALHRVSFTGAGNVRIYGLGFLPDRAIQNGFELRRGVPAAGGQPRTEHNDRQEQRPECMRPSPALPK